MEELSVKARDGYKLNIHVFRTEAPAAAIQIIHGMEEYQDRYNPFAEFLAENGFAVVSSDMRGHGKTAEKLGYFKDKNGYEELISDQRTVTDFISEQFPGIPVYIFAHSMGTIITRVLLQEDSARYAKTVLSGYPNYQRGAHLGILLSGVIRAVRGPEYKSKLLSELSTGIFNKSIPDPKTGCDWICKNEDTVRKYIDDPYCGIGFTCSAFNDLFRLVVKMHDSDAYCSVNTSMQLLMLRGYEDPCVGGDRGAEDSRRVLHKAGFRNISFTDYPEMRHEILAEKDNMRVYSDVLDFFRQPDRSVSAVLSQSSKAM